MSVRSCTSKGKNTRFKFELKEDSSSSSSSDESSCDPEVDGLNDPVFERNDSVFHVYDYDEDGSKVLNHSKCYKMTIVPERVGARINLNDIYYNKEAIKQYEKNHEKLMKYA